jgi:hypothetical protein
MSMSMTEPHDAAHHAPDRGHSPVYAERQDWTIFDNGQPVGRIYEDASASTSDDRRWFWSITVYVRPDAGIVTSGKAATLDQAKAEFQRNWINSLPRRRDARPPSG